MHSVSESARLALGGIATPIGRAGGALVFSTLSGSALGFVYWAVAARLHRSEDVGLAAAMISVVSMIASLSLCGLNFVAGRFLPVAGAQRATMVSRLTLAAVGLSLGGGLVFLSGGSVWAPALVGIGWPLLGASTAWAVFMLQDTILLGLGLAYWVPAKNGLFGLAKLGLLIVAAHTFRSSGWSAIGWPWFISMGVGALVVSALLPKSQAIKGHHGDAVRLPEPSALARFALVNHLATTLLQLPAMVYPLLVLGWLGPAATAYFYTSWMIANLLMLASSNIASAMVAQAARRDGEVRALMLVGFRYALLLVTPAAVAVIAFGRVLLSAFGAAYQEGYMLLATLALAALVYVPNSQYAGLMRVECRLRPLLLQGLIAATVSLGLSWPLAGMLGLAGFGVSFLAGQCAAAFAVWPPLVLRGSSRKCVSVRSTGERVDGSGGATEFPQAEEQWPISRSNSGNELSKGTPIPSG